MIFASTYARRRRPCVINLVLKRRGRRRDRVSKVKKAACLGKPGRQTAAARPPHSTWAPALQKFAWLHQRNPEPILGRSSVSAAQSFGRPGPRPGGAPRVVSPRAAPRDDLPRFRETNKLKKKKKPRCSAAYPNTETKLAVRIGDRVHSPRGLCHRMQPLDQSGRGSGEAEAATKWIKWVGETPPRPEIPDAFSEAEPQQGLTKQIEVVSPYKYRTSAARRCRHGRSLGPSVTACAGDAWPVHLRLRASLSKI